MWEYLIHSVAWSAFWLGVGVGVTETGWYARWRLSRGRHHHDHT